MKNANKLWSKEDVKYLKENYGVLAKKTMMKHLGRSSRAIEHKAREVFGTSRVAEVTGTYTNGDIARFFNKDVSTINIWIKKLNFPAKRFNRITNKSNMLYAYFYIVEYNEFWSWLKKNKNNICVNIKEVKLDIFGVYPDWFMEDYKNKVNYGTQKRWNKKEEECLVELYYKKSLSINEISEIMDRTPMSIKKKIQRMNNKLKLFGVVS